MRDMDEAVKPGGMITRRDMRKVFWRSFPLQASFNYERMQNIGFCYAMIPVLRRLYPERDQAARALKRHLSFFNTTPQVVTFITGVAIALEEENVSAERQGRPFDIESIAAIKAALMGPLAGIGDSFFWGTFRVIATGVGCGLASGGSPLGPILFLLIFNIPHVLSCWWGLDIGYRSGVGFIESAESSGVIEKLMGAAKVMGLCVVGAMIASMVTFSTPLVVAIGQTTIKVQDIFDQILPSILPLALTFACYVLLK
ncbi:PTS system IID component, Man family [Coriobacterium glomerans PW2]|uniref:PTS system IID component, Man family n=1 Tax=Coriobacterium glomerans (strain ATCC 49209 / DSM 20642 / JCM 10262 / PW2) TaxID=700015 RepID=F2N8K0_CORGP|nr:PTS system mannose/fructose/sorbose family transporter subunit IID [Coriobacterium glomerans]AEB07383.1 PTS system IID component, Man family [Coriobacterium glomerans PW2]